MRSGAFAVWCVALVLTACAPAPGIERRIASPTMAPPTRTLLTRSELTRMGDLESAYNAVERLRPWFLHPRPGASAARGMPPLIGVFIDGQSMGGPEVLLSLTVADVEEIRLVQPVEADLVIGAGRGLDAVINVVLRKRTRGASD